MRGPIRAQRKLAACAWVVVVAVLAPVVAAAEAGDSGEQATTLSGCSRAEWGDSYLLDVSGGWMSKEDGLFASASFMGWRSRRAGFLGTEIAVAEWVRAGDASADYVSPVPLYLHVVPYVRFRELTREEAKSVPCSEYLVDLYAGGSLWSSRDQPRGGESDGSDPGMDWGHWYLRSGVRLVAVPGWGPCGSGGVGSWFRPSAFAANVGVLWHESGGDSGAADQLTYAAIELSFGSAK